MLMTTAALAAVAAAVGCTGVQIAVLAGAAAALGVVANGRQPVRRLADATRAGVLAGQRDHEARLLAMELSLDRVRSVLEALLEGVLVVDAAGEVVLANPAARRAMPDGTQSPEGRPLWDVLCSELARRARDAFEALRDEDARRQVADSQIRYSAIPCGDRVYDLTAVPVRSARSGHDFGTVFLLVDATRGHELARLKDRFLSSISHELRTPLTNIVAYAEILASMMPGESIEWPEFVRVILDEGKALSRMVDGVFDYLQLESGDARFENAELDATALAREVVVDIAGKSAATGVDLELKVEGSPPLVVADAARLRQVCSNLIDNGLKFTPSGGKVVVTVAERDGSWSLRIDDTGPGVPTQQRQAVFEKFSQLPDHLTDKPTGTGLGLATARVIVARFGGMIWCEDSPLGGGGFVVVLPGVGQPRLLAVEAGTGAGGGF
ncbi:MAG: PAS domain-containing protein [Planctomycetes bacterium]|nr:PAS domain-containing protein [Planctomycetota bacterium]